MGFFIDITDKRYNLLKAICVVYFDKSKSAFWLFSCECGGEVITNGSLVRTGETKSCGCLLKKNVKRGSEHYYWKGDKVKYRTRHTRMYSKVPKPGGCTFCKKKKKLDLANKTGLYILKVDDWMWLCESCHRRYDHGWKFQNKKWIKECTGCNIEMEVCENNFYRRKSRPNNMSEWVSRCKKCVRSKRRELSERHS